MSHWVRELNTYEERIASLSPVDRLRVASKVISWTVRTLDPPIEDVRLSEFIADGIERCDNAVSTGNSLPAGAEEVLERYDELHDEIDEIGGTNFLDAVLLCFSFRASELNAKTVMSILLDCYEGALYRDTDQAITDAVEASNARGLEVIAQQKALIDEFAGR